MSLSIRMRSLVATPLVMLALLQGGCRTEPPPAAPGAGSVTALDALTVDREVVARVRRWEGVVEAVDRATLSAQTGGRVVELPYDVNDHVEAGAVVVRFTDVEQRSGRRQAEAAVAAAQAAASAADADQQRIAAVFARGLLPRADLDQVTARRDAARAQLETARAALRGSGEQFDYTVIRAPFSGILTERHVEIGETVQPGQPLVSGLSLSRLRVVVDIPQGDIAAVRREQRASVLLVDGNEIEASTVVVFPYADPTAHSAQVRLELPEADTGLQPGMTVRAAFVLGEREAIRVPQSALLKRGEVTAVYVVTDDGAVRLRQLRIGERDGQQVEVIAGLAAGERVAADPVAAGQWLARQRGGAQQ
jgi:RND family efflux transporter MFP subunit